MNLEEMLLMYILAMPEVFGEYEVDLSESTPLQSGKVFKHASKCNRMIMDSRDDHRVDFHTASTLAGYVQYVDGYLNDTGEI